MKDLGIPLMVCVICVVFLYFTQVRPGASGELIVWGGFAIAGLCIVMMLMSSPKRRR
jgi:hypothetical protein